MNEVSMVFGLLCGLAIGYACGWQAKMRLNAIDGPRRGPAADGSQTPNDAAAIPCVKAGSNTGPAVVEPCKSAEHAALERAGEVGHPRGAIELHAPVRAAGFDSPDDRPGCGGNLLSQNEGEFGKADTQVLAQGFGVVQFVVGNALHGSPPKGEESMPGPCSPHAGDVAAPDSRSR